MLEELGIKDDSEFPNFVRVEMIPQDDDPFNHDVGNWKLVVDQDYRPEWFDYDDIRFCMSEKMKEVFEKCFAVNVLGTTYKNTLVYAKNSNITVYNSSVRAYGNSSVRACDNSSVRAYGNSSVRACDNSSVTACDNSSVTACDNSSVTAYGNSSVLIPNRCSNVKIKEVHDLATIKDLRGRKPKIYVTTEFEVIKNVETPPKS
jgi:hypothetical protein